MKILHVGYSDILGGAAITMNRLHKAMCDRGIDSGGFGFKKLNKDLNITGASNNFEIFF